MIGASIAQLRSESSKRRRQMKEVWTRLMWPRALVKTVMDIHTSQNMRYFLAS